MRGAGPRDGPSGGFLAKRNNWTAGDRALGMDRAITRRDVLQGMTLAGAGALGRTLGGTLGGTLVGAIGSALPGASARADEAQDYPPGLTGMRGSAAGTYENAHALRDGRQWEGAQDTGEVYDLVVVGAGINGLAAAHFYRARTSPTARILLLDNHDDFGGHARSNEFHLDGRLHLLNGGTAEIDSPFPYSAVADGLLRTLGVDVEKIASSVPNPEFFRVSANQRAKFFDKETFGADKLVTGRDGKSWVHFLHEAPLSARARADIVRMEQGHVDYLAGMNSEQKKLLLSRISLLEYLRDHARIGPEALAFYGARTKGEWCVGIDAVSALDYWGVSGSDGAGMRGLKLAPGATSRMGYTPAGYSATGGSYQLHFPDGNATIARLLVRSLIPAVAPPGDVNALVSARFDYRQLDQADAPVRLRLRSTVVRAQNRTDAAPGVPAGVDISYVRGGVAYRVRARDCVLACYNMIIPALCPELPAAQKAALHRLVKSPLVYSSVAIRNARAFRRLGVRQIEAPGCYHTTTFLNAHMEFGAYRGPLSPDEPTLVHMERMPCQPGLNEDDQSRAGRAELLATSFETFERNIRDQLGRMLGPAGFDPAADITAIMVNRWPHGYAPEFNSLFDPELPLDLQPHVIGRARFGRIAIANSDSGRGAFTDVAIDQAHRAVGELLQAAP